MQVEKLTTTVFTPLDDGTGVLLNLTTLLYYSLNRTGVAIWQELEETRPSKLDDLIASTYDRFDVDEDSARQHIGAFIGQLEKLGMVRIQG
jgi:hypothetical protein